MMKSTRALTILAVASTLGGCSQYLCCSQYLDRIDTVELSDGNAVQGNSVTHMIDPWPAHARNTQIPLDGQRAAVAVENYRNPPKPPASPSLISITNVGAGAPTAK
jgi:hypothetical protein